jgi:hypothetical protein
MEFLSKTATSLHRCAMIEKVFLRYDEFFAKFIPSKRARIITYTKLAMAALECKVAMVISRLVKLELLLELKFEQKKGTSLV